MLTVRDKVSAIKNETLKADAPATAIFAGV